MQWEAFKGSGSPPAVGSVKEAVCLAVWLRHQEIEANRMRVLAQGFSDVITGNTQKTADAFKAVLIGMFPFAEKTKSTEDKDLLDKMQNEISKGPLYFSPVVMKSLKKAVKNIAVPDDFKTKLQNKVKSRKQ